MISVTLCKPRRLRVLLERVLSGRRKNGRCGTYRVTLTSLPAAGLAGVPVSTTLTITR